MRIQQFQVSLVNKTRRQLPRRLRDFEPRSFFTIVKLSYTQPRLHYEVAVRGKERLIELGLHFEADKVTNDALRAYFEARAIEIKAELGPHVEVEHWTESWSRVHQVCSYETLDEALVDRLAEQMARMITVLQPMLEDATTANRRHTAAARTKSNGSGPAVRGVQTPRRLARRRSERRSR